MNEGSKHLPWEKDAYQKENKYTIDENSPEFKKSRAAYLKYNKIKNA